MDTMCTEHITQKTEATNWRIVSKWAEHIMPRKILLVQNQVTTEYCCEWLLFTLGSRLLQGSGRGYHDVPKIKAINRQLVHKWTAHIWSSKSQFKLKSGY